MLATAWPKKPLGRSEHPSIDVEIWKRNHEYDYFCVKPTEIVRFFNQNIYLKRWWKIPKNPISTTKKHIFRKNNTQEFHFPTPQKNNSPRREISTQRRPQNVAMGCCHAGSVSTSSELQVGLKFSKGSRPWKSIQADDVFFKLLTLTLPEKT